MRQQKWSATNLATALASSDPMKAIAELVSRYWAREYQKELINLLKGVFSADTMKDHVLDISGKAGKMLIFLLPASLTLFSFWATRKTNLPV